MIQVYAPPARRSGLGPRAAGFGLHPESETSAAPIPSLKSEALRQPIKITAGGKALGGLVFAANAGAGGLVADLDDDAGRFPRPSAIPFDLFLGGQRVAGPRPEQQAVEADG